VEVVFATNLIHDVKNKNERNNMLEENMYKLASFSHVSPCIEKVNKGTYHVIWHNNYKGNDMCSMISQNEEN
jgi:hypothetical protein